MDLEYWRERYKVHEQRRNNRNKDLESSFLFLLDECLEDIYDNIYSFYGKYAEDGIVTSEIASINVDSKEMLNLLNYLGRIMVEAGNNNVEFDSDLMKTLEELSTTSNISRIEALILKLRSRIELTYGIIINRSIEHMEDTITDSYYSSVYEVFSSLGYGSKNLPKDHDDLLEFVILLLAEYWRTSDETFDDVLWRYKRELQFNVEKNIKQNSFLGFSTVPLLEGISSLFKRDNKNIKTLVETDSTFYSTKAQAEAFSDIEIHEALYCTIDDERRTEICTEADGNIIPVEDIEPWVNAPPLHYGCRSWLTPIIEKIDHLTGETYDMTDESYDTWYDKYL